MRALCSTSRIGNLLTKAPKEKKKKKLRVTLVELIECDQVLVVETEKCLVNVRVRRGGWLELRVQRVGQFLRIRGVAIDYSLDLFV